jgi:hypothetical protein
MRCAAAVVQARRRGFPAGLTAEILALSARKTRPIASLRAESVLEPVPRERAP